MHYVKIAIVGLGFVGLSFAAVLGSKNFSVLGVDHDKKKISTIISGKTPFFEPKLFLETSSGPYERRFFVKNSQSARYKPATASTEAIWLDEPLAISGKMKSRSRMLK